MTVTTKIIGATAALGTAGGIGYSTYSQLSAKDSKDSFEKTLGKALENKGHKLLNFDTQNNSDKAIWDAIIKDYESTTNKLNDLKITLPTTKVVSLEQINKLKQECQKAISSKKYSESNLLAAEQFCVTPINIKSLFEKQKYTILDTDQNDANNKSEWDQKVQNYLTKGSQNQLTGINLTSSTPTDAKGKRNELRKGCKLLEAINTHAPTFHSSYSKFKEWCSIKST